MTFGENKLYGRLYIEIEGSLETPLLIGSGEDTYTDNDLLLTVEKTPFIPGSSLAGALRSFLKRNGKKEDAEALFGTSGWSMREDRTEEIIEYQSRIFVLDTLLENSHIITRDNVRLDEFKTSEESSKYEMQAVKAASFKMRLEILIRNREVETCTLEEAFEWDKARLAICIAGMQNGSLRLGAKSNRGFGVLNVASVRTKTFNMECEEDFHAWLKWKWEFAPDSEWSLASIELSKSDKEHCLEIPLKIKSTILIREYTAFAPKSEGIGEADYMQLTSRDGCAVIPGSTWAGAIRSYLANIIKMLSEKDSWEDAQNMLEPFFGSWERKASGETKWASCLSFDETQIIGGHAMPVVRTAVDRFTGGAAKKALYEEIFWVGGETVLRIRWSENRLKQGEQQVLLGMMLWVVNGLRDGFLAVGGETAVGRGMFDAGVVKLDGEDLRDGKESIKAADRWCQNVEKGQNERNNHA